LSTQLYSCVMIPDFIDIGSVWPVLPPGIHEASLEEIELRFATNKLRIRLFDGFKNGITALRLAGCKIVFIDGSYIAEKPYPGDFDVCWDPTGVDTEILDPVFLDFSDNRSSQKLKFGGEFFPSSNLADAQRTFIDFFQIDKHTEKAKGIIMVRLV